MKPTYKVELELDELWYKALMDFIFVDIYENEVCKIVNVEKVDNVRV
jgi:hypothetical protein